MFLFSLLHPILLIHFLMSNSNGRRNGEGNRTRPLMGAAGSKDPSIKPIRSVKPKKTSSQPAPSVVRISSKKPTSAGTTGTNGSSTSQVTTSGNPKKLGKRALQLAAMEKKAEAEDDYFRQCQREAQRQHHSTPITNEAREEELFGMQGAQGINFGKYDDIQVQVKLPDAFQKSNDKKHDIVRPLTHFDDLTTTTTAASTLDATLRQNIQRMRYTTPTPIQRHAIPHAMAGQDLLCCAQTGSGKTCAFLLPICAALATTPLTQPTDATTFPVPTANTPLGKKSKTPCSPRCIILAPTRELASQIELEAQKLTYGMTNVRPVAVYGGANQRQQLRALAFGADLVVATPGRLTDFVDRGIVSLAMVQYLILDEADRMLDMGFEPQIRRLVLKSDMMTKERGRQTLMFSATFPAPIQKLAGEFMRPYVWIAVGRVGSTTDSITQVIVKATSEKKHKLKLVVEAIEKGPSGRTLVFVQKKRTATWLKKQLTMGGAVGDTKKEDYFQPIAAQDIHGDRSQSQREKALAAFREGTTCTVLVATDVAARGLDISGVEHVINMDLPVAKDDFDSYVHRIGRTGRAGHVGLATSLFVPGYAPAGNGKIAAVLVSQLREAKQEVPAWLEKEVSASGATGPTSSSKFVSTDVRRAGGGRGSSGPSGAKQPSTTGARSGGGRSSGVKQGSAPAGRGRGPANGGRGGRGSTAKPRGDTTSSGPSAVK